MLKLVFISIAVGVFLASLPDIIKIMRKKREKEREKIIKNNIELATKRAGEIGPIFYVNWNKKCFAICKAKDFKEEYEKYKKDLEEKKKKPWEKMKLKIKPTFTFYEDVRLNFTQTESRYNAELFLESMVEHVIGFKKADLFDSDPYNKDKSFNRIKKILINDSENFFIPFCNEDVSKEEEELYDEKFSDFLSIKRYLAKDARSPKNYELVF